jgi:hypothetical protein
MNQESQKPARFQIHLSTAILMMFVAGALIRANMSGPWHYVHGEKELAYKTFGWPLYIGELQSPLIDGAEKRGLGGPYWQWVDHLAVPFDGMVGLVLLIILWLVCEWWIRQREQKQRLASS